MKLNINKNVYIFFIIILSGYILDIYWTKLIDIVPAWDQGFHLSNSYQFSNLIKDLKLFDSDWWKSFWSITDNYRGPLTYIISSLFINLFGSNIQNAILSNIIFSFITSTAILIFCKKFLNYEIGLWAIFLYTFNSYIFNLRNDFLLDIPQLSFILLTSLFLIFWFDDNKNKIVLPLFAGTSLGFLFLTKPSALIFFIVPISFLVYKKFNKKNIFNGKSNFQLILFLLSFLLIIKPWLSLNWLTILTSTLNAWQWGLKYQDGLEANTIGAWIYYPVEIVKAVNPIIIFITIFNYLIFKIRFHKSELSSFFHINKKFISNKTNIFIISIPFNIILINIIMTTKDARFAIPLLPFIFILLGSLIYEINNRYLVSRVMKVSFASIVIFIFLSNKISLYSNQKNLFSFSNKPNDIHTQIIKEIQYNSPNINSTVGFLPDTKSYNAFNLDAEAVRNNRGIRVRQITSNKDSYKRDLKLFDWFVVKTGEQGEMKSFSKEKLTELLLNSDSFEIFKEWKLHDNSILKLIKRKNISQNIKISNCINSDIFLKTALSEEKSKINIQGQLSDINESYLILKFNNFSNHADINIALPQLNTSGMENKCISYTYEFENNFYFKKNDKKLDFDAYIFNPNSGQEFKLINNNKYFLKDKQYLLASNKIDYVSQMGSLLKMGDFDALFNLAGQINQSDPNLNYLRNSEIIYKKKIKQNINNLDYLYSLAISEILQKKAREALLTTNKIISIDPDNANIYIANAIIKLYLFNINSANKSLRKAILLNKNKEITETLNTIYSITKILNFDFIDDIKS